MEFVHRPYTPGDTIAALATPPGEGGVAIVRICGKRAIAIGSKVFSGRVASFASHTLHFGRIIDAQGAAVDEGLLCVMRAPHSYTGEETVEIHCHGGSLVSRQVLDTVLKAGARAALPGEFTLKAFMNGKIDLAQAEAVQALISAKSQLGLTCAKQQLEGALSRRITSLQQQLFDIAAILEAWVDFPEEGLEFASHEEIVSSLKAVLEQMQQLYDSFHEGRIAHEGLSLCLAGPPNAGKSSLMNALLGKPRSIVTPIPGTTRDLVEEDLRLGQIHFRLADTAGIRPTEEIVESEGIRLSFDAMGKADLILLVMDSSRPLEQEEQTLLARIPKSKTLLVWNKIDISNIQVPAHDFLGAVSVSAKTGEGLVQLREQIERCIWRQGPPAKDEVVISSLRHHQALGAALAAGRKVVAGLQTEVSPEFLALDMRLMLDELGTIIGKNITEEVLSAIFSKFCVGK